MLHVSVATGLEGKQGTTGIRERQERQEPPPPKIKTNPLLDSSWNIWNSVGMGSQLHLDTHGINQLGNNGKSLDHPGGSSSWWRLGMNELSAPNLWKTGMFSSKFGASWDSGISQGG